MTAYVVDIPPSYNFEFNGVDIELKPTGDVSLAMDPAKVVLFTLADNIADAFVMQDAAQPLFSVHTTAADRRVAVRDALQIGLDPGSGAGSAAATGGLRLQGNGAVLGRLNFRDAADGGDIAGMSLLAADELSVGGPYPTRPPIIYVEAQTVAQICIAGGARVLVYNTLVVAATSVEVRGTDVYFGSTIASPVISHATDATAGVVGDDLTFAAQSVSDPAGNATSGNLGLRGGQGLVHAGNTDGNVWFHVAAANYQGMEKGIFVADVVTAPTAALASGAAFWSEGGLLQTYAGTSSAIDGAFGLENHLAGEVFA